MILCLVCYFELSTRILHFNIKKNPGEDGLPGFILPFPFCENTRYKLFFKDLFSSLGASRWVLEVHGGASGSWVLKGQVLLKIPFTSPQQWDRSRPSVPEGPPGWSCPARIKVRWGVRWAGDTDGKCLCVACCMGSHLGCSQKNQRRRMFSGDCRICTLCLSPIHLHRLLLSCSAICFTIHGTWADPIWYDWVSVLGNDGVLWEALGGKT